MGDALAGVAGSDGVLLVSTEMVGGGAWTVCCGTEEVLGGGGDEGIELPRLSTISWSRSVRADESSCRAAMMLG